MLKHGDTISFILVCLAIIMMGVSNALICRQMNKMDQKITSLEEQNEKILEEYNLQKDELQEIKSLHATYASETDAKLNILAGDLQELKLEKEVKDVELHQEEEVEEPSGDKSNMTPIGVYELTAYEWTGNPCANGNYPTTCYTVACNSLALGTRIYIEGYGEYVVEDRGGMADNVIDIYYGDVDACYQFGRRSAQVYIIND